MNKLISMRDLRREDILELLSLAEKIETGQIKPRMDGMLAALLFFEPSTRTFFSFETAVKRLGGATLTMAGTSGTSVSKGESMHDTLTTIDQYADLIVMRTTQEGAARYASEVLRAPVINAGDGANQHPTQAMLDLYSILKTQHTLEGLTVGLVGDLLLGRTVHSLAQALSDFKAKLIFASPSHLRMPDYIKEDLAEKGIEFMEVAQIEPYIPELDILYVTRIQRERFADPDDYEKVKNSYIITPEMLRGARPNFRVLHPLPRVNEIARGVDDTPYAYYFQQARNGVYTRQAIISKLLGLV